MLAFMQRGIQRDTQAFSCQLCMYQQREGRLWSMQS